MAKVDAEVKIVVFTTRRSSDAAEVLNRHAAEQELTRLVQEGWGIVSVTHAGDETTSQGAYGPTLCVILQKG